MIFGTFPLINRSFANFKRNMDRNTIIGFILIFAVIMVWNQFFFQPEMEAAKIKQHQQDSLKALTESIPNTTIDSNSANQNSKSAIADSSSIDSSSISQTKEETRTLSNDLVAIELSSKGAAIKSVKLSKYNRIFKDQSGHDQKETLMMMNDKKNVFEYLIPVQGKVISTKDLIFQIRKSSDQEIEFETSLSPESKLVLSYSLKEGHYILDHQIKFEGKIPDSSIAVIWNNYLNHLEANSSYERNYSSVYFKERDQDPDYCSCTKDDKIVLQGKSVQWISHVNQFFNSSIISSADFVNAENETVMLPQNADNLKLIKTKFEIPASQFSGGQTNLQWYIGPNIYSNLKNAAPNLESIIPYGWSVFGTINRYVIRPLFLFLENFIGSKGILILLMTLIVKIVVFPLGYKMLQSQAKMTALKPEIDKIKAKYKDDMQKQQMETMKIYNEFGVNPLGGCFPLLLQMPIWIALYRFFPATIEFRQESFLWATDLTSYDVFATLPFSIPMFGATVSLFAFLWMLSTLVFTYYSSKSMDFSSNPAMLYMQYLMPVMFWVMFNKTAAGLTVYMFFSNLLNIAQTILGKNFLFDTEKIRAKLELNKSKPKKQGGFRDRFESLMKEQQRIQQEKLKKK
jgi:YidC/Oxa1 family membrane protein insertase